LLISVGNQADSKRATEHKSWAVISVTAPVARLLLS
jgi:hypothetical protein